MFSVFDVRNRQRLHQVFGEEALFKDIADAMTGKDVVTASSAQAIRRWFEEDAPRTRRQLTIWGTGSEMESVTHDDLRGLVRLAELLEHADRG